MLAFCLHTLIINYFNKPNDTIYAKEIISPLEREVLSLDTDYSSDNKDVVGKLIIKSLDIEEKVLQGEDNDFYLNHDENKKYYIWGNVVLDFRNNISDKQYYIFGHNSRKANDENAKFQKLENYTDREFFEKGEHIYFIYEGKVKVYEPLLVKLVTTDNEHTKVKFKDDEDWQNHITKLRENSLYDTGVTVSNDDNILILQTCYYKPVKSFLLVVFREIN